MSWDEYLDLPSLSPEKIAEGEAAIHRFRVGIFAVEDKKFQVTEHSIMLIVGHAEKGWIRKHVARVAEDMAGYKISKKVGRTLIGGKHPSYYLDKLLYRENGVGDGDDSQGRAKKS